jgi:hypothetical protein
VYKTSDEKQAMKTSDGKKFLDSIPKTIVFTLVFGYNDHWAKEAPSDD